MLRALKLSQMAASAGRILGPLVFAAMLVVGPPEGLAPAGWAVVALLVWMVVWWISEAVPVAATALLPLVLLPMVGAGNPREAAAPYADPIIFLFIGGFMLAASVERWGLHRRLALAFLARVGGSPPAILAGFMAVTALLSMWISNTAACLMLVPIALGVAKALSRNGAMPSGLGGALVLGVGYAASIGGIGTPVGSPTNLVAVGYLERQGLAIAFTDWMAAAVPVMLVLLAIAWAVLAAPMRKAARGDRAAFGTLIADERVQLGPMGRGELRVLLLFGCVALGWMARPLLQEIPGLSGLNDTGIAVAGAIALFLVPGGDGRQLMDWSTAERIPWGIALLFGGGLSLAAAMDSTGVTEWLGASLDWMAMLPALLVVGGIAMMIIFATEVASNTATLSAFLPVVAGVAVAIGIEPLALLFPAAIAASLAFMMPIGTPPNAIAYATGMISLPHMMRVGLLLNLLSVLAVVAMSAWLLPLFIG